MEWALEYWREVNDIVADEAWLNHLPEYDDAVV